MTTIAYRDGVMAADSLLSCGDGKNGFVVKIVKDSKGRLVGACGEAGFAARFRQSAEYDAFIWPQKDEGTGIVVWSDGRCEFYEHTGPFTVTANYVAMGSGRPEALGAMFAGADPETAVKAAIEHDCHTGGDVLVLTL